MGTSCLIGFLKYRQRDTWKNNFHRAEEPPVKGNPNPRRYEPLQNPKRGGGNYVGLLKNCIIILQLPKRINYDLTTLRTHSVIPNNCDRILSKEVINKDIQLNQRSTSIPAHARCISSCSTKDHRAFIEYELDVRSNTG